MLAVGKGAISSYLRVLIYLPTEIILRSSAISSWSLFSLSYSSDEEAAFIARWGCNKLTKDR
ncbi:MAG: hypothetical protein WAN35_14905, partial [Terracidiphilus sp.]